MRTWRTPAPASASAVAMAVPETIETSCSADGPPSRTTIGGRARGALGAVTPATASPPSRRGTRSRTRARRRGARAMTARTCSASRRTSAAVPFWSLTMKLACFSDTTAPPIRWPLRPGLLDEPPGRVAVGVAEDAPGRRQPERLVGLAPAADLVEARLDDVRVGRAQLEGRVEHQLGRSRPAGTCLNRLSR